jgi:predicted HAD superfamily Cof-like phosphohydrolase
MYKTIKQFTNACALSELPIEPKAMCRKAVEFIVSMVLSEMAELLETVCFDEKDRDETMIRLLGVDSHKTIKKPESLKRKIADQADALVDAIYYINDCAAKHGMDLDLCLEEVHGANLRKVDPLTGKVIRREDGKILKPEGWSGPCLEKVLFPFNKDVDLQKENVVFYSGSNKVNSDDENIEWFDVIDHEFESFEPNE